MGKKEKLMERLLSSPADFTFRELESLLSYWGYQVCNKGRTSGSRIAFISDKYPSILLHKPHSRNYLLNYQVKEVIVLLRKEGLL